MCRYEKKTVQLGFYDQQLSMKNIKSHKAVFFEFYSGFHQQAYYKISFVSPISYLLKDTRMI